MAFFKTIVSCHNWRTKDVYLHKQWLECMLSCCQMGLIQTENRNHSVHFGAVNLCESGALEWLQDNPCKGNGFAGSGHGSLLSAYPSWLILLFTCVLIIAGSMGQYFQSIHVAPIVQLTHKWHHKKVCCVFHDFQVRRRDARRWGVTWEGMDRATEDH